MRRSAATSSLGMRFCPLPFVILSIVGRVSRSDTRGACVGDSTGSFPYTSFFLFRKVNQGSNNVSHRCYRAAKKPHSSQGGHRQMNVRINDILVLSLQECLQLMQ
uniref:Putative secreted protein n=1 Tax=Amblyomma americanum TaxID=6943 RepID=A0A0C9S3I8_AMBAM